MRKNIVAGNWKMNKTFDEADELVSQIIELLETKELGENTRMILCPPFPYLEMCTDYSNESYFSVGAQNVNDNEKGAYTGEVSAPMLASMEVEYCIVGHSERRAYYGETDAIVARKVDQLLKNDIRPIVCCGEVLEEREAGKQFDVVKRQITDGLFHLDAEAFGQDLPYEIGKIKAIGGGDLPEDWVGAYKKVNNDINWRNGNKVIFHIADAGAHGKRFTPSDK